MRTELIQADVTAVVLALVGIIWSFQNNDLGVVLGLAALIVLTTGTFVYS